MLTVALVALVSALAGAVFGWLATRQFSPEWVGAVGQWVGGLGTIAALIWAVLLFRHERDREGEKLEATARTAAKRAARVTVVGERPNYSPGEWFYAYIRVFNGTTEPIVITAVSVESLQYRESDGVPKRVGGGKDEVFQLAQKNAETEIAPPEEFNRHHPATVEFELSGTAWTRTGSEPPAKL